MNMCDMCWGKLRNEHPYLSTKNGKTKKSWNSGSEIIKKDEKKLFRLFFVVHYVFLLFLAGDAWNIKKIELNQIKIILHDIKKCAIVCVFFGAKIPHDAGFVINLEQTIEEL